MSYTITSNQLNRIIISFQDSIITINEQINTLTKDINNTNYDQSSTQVEIVKLERKKKNLENLLEELTNKTITDESTRE